jgi:hypothetical protein
VARSAAIALSVAVSALVAVSSAGAVETVALTTAPNLPALTGVTLNGGTQTTNTTWNLTTSAFKITSSGTPFTGWNLTVNGDATGGRSAVFKEYCPNATCGPHSGPGYIAGGPTLPADSLTWNSTGASWTGVAPTPAYQCNAGCHIDNASAVKVVSAASTVANTAWTTTGATTTLSLATPASLLKLQTNEVYRLNLVWTVSTGP